MTWKWTEFPRIELGKGITGRIIAIPIAKDLGVARKFFTRAPLEEDFFAKRKVRLVEHEGRLFVVVGVKGKEDARLFGAKAWRAVEAFLGPVKFHLYPDFLPGSEVLEGALLAAYKFTRYFTDLEERPWIVYHGSKEELEAVLAKVRGIYIARDVTNEPPNAVYPESLAEIARELFVADPRVDVEVYPSSWLREHGFGGIMAVGKGSANKPRLIVLTYRGNKEKQQWDVLLVGKGVCFDAGGIHLKPTGYIEDMKMDMAGAAAVLGAIWALKEMELKVNVAGIIPAVENMPSGEATKPGDVIKMYNGKTVEVFNTDAEGRLILADALAYGIERFKPTYTVDLATLTGACIVALGRRVAGIMGNDPQLIESLIQAGKRAGELLWQLPMFEHYAEALKSDIADIRNCAEKSYAGAIIGAKFLENFVEGTKWAHLDIAGPAMAQKPWLWHPKGATGFGVATVVEWLKSLQ